MGGGLVEAVGVVLELFEEAVLLLELLELFELLDLLLFLRAQGGRSVCCGGDGGVGPGWSWAFTPRVVNTPTQQMRTKNKVKRSR